TPFRPPRQALAQQFSFWRGDVGRTSGLPVPGASGPGAESETPLTGRSETCPHVGKMRIAGSRRVLVAVCIPGALANIEERVPMKSRKRHIVVVGAGFGGLTFCQHLRSRSARISLVDRQNHHLFQPLLYQVAAAGLAAPHIAQPNSSILPHQGKGTLLLGTGRKGKLSLKTGSCGPKEQAFY